MFGAGVACPGARLFLGLLLLFAAVEASFAASLQRVDNFGENPGRLSMHLYVPEAVEQRPALVVALHGCGQQASDFDDETGLAALADAHRFILLFPEQSRGNNPTLCFNWFDPDDNERDNGESASIRRMITHAEETLGVDASRVFVLGLSAGGSMTAVLLATYPELFQSGAIIAGTPYGCNAPTAMTWAWWQWLRTFTGDAAAASFACGLLRNAPLSREPESWGDFVRDATNGTPDRWPTLSVWQGRDDRIVHRANLKELVKQWTNVHGIDAVPDGMSDANGIRHQVYRDGSGEVRLETYEVDNFPHAVPIDPGTGPEQCGIAADYTRDANICSAAKIIAFWGLVP